MIYLAPPHQAHTAEFRQALIESYNEHRHFLHWASPDPTIERVTGTMDRAIARFETKMGEQRFVVLDTVDDHLVGCIGLTVSDDNLHCYEIGYWMRSSETGKGYGTAAVVLIEIYARETLHAHKLIIITAGTNLASQRVATKAGFVLELVTPNARRLPSGEPDGTYLYTKTV